MKKNKIISLFFCLATSFLFCISVNAYEKKCIYQERAVEGFKPDEVEYVFDNGEWDVIYRDSAGTEYYDEFAFFEKMNIDEPCLQSLLVCYNEQDEWGIVELPTEDLSDCLVFYLSNEIIYNYQEDDVISCGSVGEIPRFFAKTVSVIYNVIQVAVPIVLVIFGMLDLLKGISAQKEDEIKKGQQLLVKRVISACLVFFVFVIVKFVVSFAADSNSSDIIKCVECFINDNCNG